jgi:hypothetical protein
VGAPCRFIRAGRFLWLWARPAAPGVNVETGREQAVGSPADRYADRAPPETHVPRVLKASLLRWMGPPCRRRAGARTTYDESPEVVLAVANWLRIRPRMRSTTMALPPYPNRARARPEPYLAP